MSRRIRPAVLRAAELTWAAGDAFLANPEDAQLKAAYETEFAVLVAVAGSQSEAQRAINEVAVRSSK